MDIGSSKICAIIAEIKDGAPQVIGASVQKSEGVRKGSISNISQAGEIVKKAIEDAKRMAGLDFVEKAIVSISGAYTQSVNSSGIINVPNNEITLKEINRALDTALHNAAIPSGHEVIHILPYQFKLDNQDNIEDPMGMSGSRLEVFTHIVTVQHSSLENLRRTIQLAGVKIENIVLSAYAASIATLSEDERALGVACIDIGGSTCNIMVYEGSSMRFNSYVPVGSEHIRDDLAIGLHTPLGAAEYVKREYGNLMAEESDQEIEVPAVGAENKKNRFSLKFVHEIINTRVLEVFNLLNNALISSKLKDSLGRGVVLTGGMTHMEGIRHVASAIFGNVPVRIAKPIEVSGLFEELKDPTSSVAIGLILYGAGGHTNYEKDSEKTIRYKEIKQNAQPAFTYTPERNYIETDLTNLKHTGETNKEIKERKKDIMYPYETPKEAGFFQRIREWGSKLFWRRVVAMLNEMEIGVEEIFETNGAKIVVIGVGGGGSNMIAHLIATGTYKDIMLIVANTDGQALKSSTAKNKIRLGEKITGGRGAGMKPEVGKQAAQECVEVIKNMVTGADIVFISAGLGGGTGTGAAPVIAQIAKDSGALTVSVVTKPFSFEGRKRARIAEEGLKELKAVSDSIVVIPNEKLIGFIDKNAGIKESFKEVDNILAKAVNGISSMIINYGENDINVDFADLKTVMNHRGLALMGIGEATGVNAATVAVENAIASPLFDNVSINGAMGVLINFECHPDYPLLEITNSVSIVESMADEDADIIFGKCTSTNTPTDHVKVTIVATGFEKPVENKEEGESKPSFSLSKSALENLKMASSGETFNGVDLDKPTFLRNQKD